MSDESEKEKAEGGLEANLLKVDFGKFEAFGSKLVDTIATGIAGFARPWQIRRVALADADARRALAEANADAAVFEEQGNVRALELRHRTFTRLVAQEEQRQRNIEAIIQESPQYGREIVSPAIVEPDWVASFLESCQDVSEQTLRSLWAKLLAGEISEPGSVSKQLLNAVRQMSPQDAKEFSLLTTEVVTKHPWNWFNGPYFFAHHRGEMSCGGIDAEPFILLNLAKGWEMNFSIGLSKKPREIEFYGQKVLISSINEVHDDPRKNKFPELGLIPDRPGIAQSIAAGDERIQIEQPHIQSGHSRASEIDVVTVKQEVGILF